MKKIIILSVMFSFIYACNNSSNKTGDNTTDSTVVTESEKKSDVYKYFSKEEIQEQMNYATAELTKSIDEGETEYAEIYEKLLTTEGFWGSPAKLEEKWGTANKKNNSIYTDERKTIYLDFDQFEIGLDSVISDWKILSLSVETVGFGFGGVFVGVPECDKKYVEELYKNFNIEKDIVADNEHWLITISDIVYEAVSITFSEDGIIKKIELNCQTYVG